MPEHADLFGRAALVARDGERFEMIDDLTPYEREALIYERDHKWHGSKMLWYSISLCAVVCISSNKSTFWIVSGSAFLAT